MSSTKKKQKKLIRKGKSHKKANRQRVSLSATVKDVKIKLKVELDGADASTVREAMAPFNPLLEWLTESLEQQSVAQQNETQQSQVLATTATAAVPQTNTAEVVPMARFPYKSRPCKGCPAKSGGLCKCARKKARRKG